MFESLKKLSKVEDESHDINTASLSRIELLDYVACEICNTCRSYFAFKGGYSLSKMLTNPRMTMDIDMSIQAKEDYEELKTILFNIATKLVNDGIASNFEIKDSVSETSSGGIKIYDLNGALLLGVDIGYHQLVYGIQKFDFNFDEVNVFCPERMLADKISSLLSRSRFRRIKDIYDLYTITVQYKLDYALMKQLVDMRLEGKENLWENIPYTDTVINEMFKAYDKFTAKSYFDESELEKPDFSKVLSRFYKLTIPLREGVEYTSWDEINGRWI